MKFFSAFITGVALLSSVLALPTLSTSNSSALEARAQCPDVQTIVDWLKDNSKVGAKTVFYSAGATNQDAKTYAGHIGAEYYGSAFPNHQFRKWIWYLRGGYFPIAL
jgi:hypothetical protein